MPLRDGWVSNQSKREKRKLSPEKCSDTPALYHVLSYASHFWSLASMKIGFGISHIQIFVEIKGTKVVAHTVRIVDGGKIAILRIEESIILVVGMELIVVYSVT